MPAVCRFKEYKLEIRALAKNVIIHLPRVGEDHVVWAMADERGALTSEVRSGTLEQAANEVEGRRSVLVLPGNDVLLAEATVPGGSAARAMQAIPFQLEDQLADDVDSLHFAVGTKGKSDDYPVAVIGRDTMDIVRDHCAQAGLRPSEIVPETLALPKFEPDEMGESKWTALVDGETAVVRLNGFAGFSTDTDMAGIMLDGAQQNLPENTSASMVVYRTDPHIHMQAPENMDVETRACESRLSLYASGLASAPRINLLQGDYSPKKQFDKTWKPWRWTAMLAGILGLTLVAGKALEYRQLSSQVAQLDSQIETVFKEALPSSRMVRPLTQMENHIKKLSGGDFDGFTSNLSQIAASLATQPQTKLRSISFREGRFDLDLTTDAIPTLDLLKAELKKRGDLVMTVQSANNEKDGLRGRVRIE